MLTTMTTIGENIMRLREGLDISQAELAERMQVKQPQVWKWEKDKSGLPETPTLFKLAKGLECSIEDLLDGVDLEYTQFRTQALLDVFSALAEEQELTSTVSDAAKNGVIPGDERSRQVLAATYSNTLWNFFHRLNLNEIVELQDKALMSVAFLKNVKRLIPADYQPASQAGVTPSDQTLLDQWHALPADVKEALGGTIKHMAEKQQRKLRRKKSAQVEN